MLKKLIIASIVCAAISNVYAAAPYLGVGVGERTNTATASNYRSMSGTILGGYGGVVNQNFYLAGELAAELGTTSISSNTLSGTTSVKTSYGYSLGILPGLMLSDHTMAFARLGIVRSRFSSASTNSTGGQAGVGLQTSLAQCWDLRGEYIYTGYNSVSGVSGNPRADQYNVSLLYKFE